MKFFFFKRANLMQRMTLAFVTLYVLMLGTIMLTFYTHLKNSSEETVAESLNQLTQYNAQQILSNFEHVELVADTIGSSYFGLYERLQEYNGTPSSCLSVFKSAKKLLQNYSGTILSPLYSRYKQLLFADSSLRIFPELSSLPLSGNLFYGETAWIYNDLNVKNEEWFLSAAQNSNINLWFTMPENPGTLFIARHIDFYAIDDNGFVSHVSLGTLLIAVDTAEIWTSIDYANFAYRPQYLLVDTDGKVLGATISSYSNQSFEQITGTKWTAEGTLHSEVQIDKTSYSAQATRVNAVVHLVTLVPTVDLRESVIRFEWTLGILMAVALIAGCVLIHELSLRLSAPMVRLSEHMRTRFMQPVALPRSCSEKNSDTFLLYSSYNQLIAQIEQEMEEKLTALQNEKNAQIKFLQAQISPHFLCNTLNSVCCVAALHGETEIMSALSNLTTLLQYNLASSDIETTLQKELEIIRNYIRIQNFQHNNVIFVDFDIESGTEQLVVLKMLLQPLLENCITHGMRNGTVEIAVSSVTENNHLKIFVEDNGAGSNVEEINASLNTPDLTAPERRHGYGIRNVHQRIVMKYGAAFGLHYTHSDAGGLIACVDVPADAVYSVSAARNNFSSCS